jgi:hypothetical protein
MWPRTGFRVFLLGVGACATACLLTISPLPTEGVADDSGSTRKDASASDPDGTFQDAGPGTDGGSRGDADAAPFEFLTNGGFELPSSGSFPCGTPWGIYQSTLTWVTTANSGTHACRVCSLSGTPGATFSINYDSAGGNPPVDAGTAIVARARVRALPGVSTTQKANITIRIYSGAAIVDRNDGTAVPLGDAFATIEAHLKPVASGTLNVYVTSDAPAANDCFIVDDVEVSLE